MVRSGRGVPSFTAIAASLDDSPPPHPSSRCHSTTTSTRCRFLLPISPHTSTSRHVRRLPLDNGPGPARYVNFVRLALTPSETYTTAKPAAALVPFTRAAPVAFIHNSSSKSATMERPALVKGNPGTPPPMKKGMPTNVPLPSQEGKQGVMQYALYVECSRSWQHWRRNTDDQLQDHS